jgi:hypothetical protein
MTLTEALQQIHILLEKSTDYPSSTEGDYLVRKALVNNAIQVWESEEGVLWNELFATLSSDDGDAQTSKDTADYDCPSEFKFPCGFLRIGTQYYNLIRPSNVQTKDNDTTSHYWYVTGNANSRYTFHISPTPTESDLDIKFDYYKSATLMEEGDDIIEMSDPQFCVYWALYELVKDEDPSLAQDYRDIALNKLRAMKTRNIMPAFWQDNQMDDYFQGSDFGK